MGILTPFCGYVLAQGAGSVRADSESAYNRANLTLVRGCVRFLNEHEHLFQKYSPPKRDDRFRLRGAVAFEIDHDHRPGMAEICGEARSDQRFGLVVAALDHLRDADNETSIKLARLCCAFELQVLVVSDEHFGLTPADLRQHFGDLPNRIMDNAIRTRSRIESWLTACGLDAAELPKN